MTDNKTYSNKDHKKIAKDTNTIIESNNTSKEILTCIDDNQLHNLKQLSRARLKLIETMLHPDHYNKTVTELCEVADVSRATYYLAIATPEFKEAMDSAAKSIVASKLGAITEALVETAATVGREGTQDRRTALEMAGHIAGKGTKVQINNNLDFREIMKSIDGGGLELPPPIKD